MQWMILLLMEGTMKRAAVAALCLGLTACGSTGGNEASQAGGSAISSGALADSGVSAGEDHVILKIAADGDLGGRLISGIEFTLTLPPGVTLDATANGEVAAGEIAASGANVNPEYVMARYSPGAVRVALINANGFPGGEFLTVSCNRAGRTAVTATDFAIEDFRAADFSPAVIATAVPSVTVDIR